MKSRFLIIDGDNLCYRAYYSRSGLSFGGSPTGALFGFFTDISVLMDIHQSETVIFCFDHGVSLRKKILPGYKAKRLLDQSPEKVKDKSEMRKQIELLKFHYLKEVGFSNIWVQDGYEADDLIAHAVNQLKDEEVIIVSGDKDLYQLLSPTVSIWQPIKNKSYWLQDLYKEYGVSPEEWVLVKCMAGCTTDNIPGVVGVGEKTACKYIMGKLKKTTIAFRNIVEGWKLIHLNRRLVELPMEGVEEFQVKEDDVSPRAWKTLMKKLGMKSLEGKVPIPNQRSLF